MCISPNDWGNVLGIWCSDYWKMHLLIKSIIYLPDETLAQVLTITTQVKQNYSFPLGTVFLKISSINRKGVEETTDWVILKVACQPAFTY